MKIIRNIIVAFSLYSKIPVPIFEWKEDDMKHNLVFLPWIGAVIGGIITSLSFVFRLIELPELCKGALYSLVPLFVTGGFHLDGFMDVQDALKSYKPKEEKLKILKDPHIGAFSVISLVKLLLVALAASVFIVTDENLSSENVYVIALIFVVSRCISGLTSLYLKKAKKNGMLSKEAGDKKKSSVILLTTQLVISVITMLILDPITALPALVFFAGYTLYYKAKTAKEFGGVTGDTAGMFVSVSETGAACMVAIVMLILRML